MKFYIISVIYLFLNILGNIHYTCQTAGFSLKISTIWHASTTFPEWKKFNLLQYIRYELHSKLQSTLDQTQIRSSNVTKSSEVAGKSHIWDGEYETEMYRGGLSTNAKEVSRSQHLFPNPQQVDTRMGIWSPQTRSNTHGQTTAWWWLVHIYLFLHSLYVAQMQWYNTDKQFSYAITYIRTWKVVSSNTWLSGWVIYYVTSAWFIRSSTPFGFSQPPLWSSVKICGRPVYTSNDTA